MKHVNTRVTIIVVYLVCSLYFGPIPNWLHTASMMVYHNILPPFTIDYNVSFHRWPTCHCMKILFFSEQHRWLLITWHWPHTNAYNHFTCVFFSVTYMRFSSLGMWFQSRAVYNIHSYNYKLNDDIFHISYFLLNMFDINCNFK